MSSTRHAYIRPHKLSERLDYLGNTTKFSLQHA